MWRSQCIRLGPHLQSQRLLFNQHYFSLLFQHYIHIKAVCLQLEGKAAYEYHEPTQSPIKPPYEVACQLKKNDRLAKVSQPQNETGVACTPPKTSQQKPVQGLDEEVVGGLDMSGVEELLGAVGGVTVEVGAGDAPCAEEEFIRGIKSLNFETE